MTSPINPILVVRNNLPEWKAMLHEERLNAVTRVDQIDRELVTIERLEAALAVDNSD